MIIGLIPKILFDFSSGHQNDAYEIGKIGEVFMRLG